MNRGLSVKINNISFSENNIKSEAINQIKKKISDPFLKKFTLQVLQNVLEHNYVNTDKYSKTFPLNKQTCNKNNNNNNFNVNFNQNNILSSSNHIQNLNNNVQNIKNNSKFAEQYSINYIKNSKFINNSEHKMIKKEYRQKYDYGTIYYEVYKTNDNKLIKKYYYDEIINLVDFVVETSFQIAAYYETIACTKCNSDNIKIIVPKILFCANVKNQEGNFPEKYVYFIEMEFVPMQITLQKIIDTFEMKPNFCGKIKNIIEYIDNCLKEHHIYHNDLNPENIGFSIDSDDKIKKLYLIDFGQAADTINSPTIQFGEIKYRCTCKRKRSNNCNNNLNNISNNKLNKCSICKLAVYREKKHNVL